MTHDEFTKAARVPDEDIGLDPPLHIPCARCDGELRFTGFNTQRTIAFLDCQGKCKHSYAVDVLDIQFSMFAGYPPGDHHG